MPFEVYGFEDEGMENNGLKQRINAVADGIDEKLINALSKAAMRVEAEAKKKCPVDKGELRASITHEIEKGQNIASAVIGSNLEYSVYVEFGTGLFAKNGDGRKDVPWCYKDADGKFHITRGQHPHPFLIPAYLENTDFIVDCLKEVVKNHD